MARRRNPAREPTIAQGGLALMLCEAILLVLLERRILEKEKIIEAIDCMADIVAELAAGHGGHVHALRESLTVSECSAILNTMRLSFHAHD